MKRIPVREILWLFILTRLFMLALTYISYIAFNAPAHFSDVSTPVDLSALLASWNRWDASNYVRIAQYGYLPLDVAFFPLFPFLITCISHVLGSWSYLLVGTLISNFALLAALFIIYQLATDQFGDEISQRTLLYLCIFPTALFFFAAYNESLYICFAAGTFLALHRQRWWLAGLLGLLAALTRNVGILLVIPYLCELWLQREQLASGFWKRLLMLLPIIAIPLGTVIYAIYCWWLLGNPLAFLTIQQHAGRHLSWPWTGIVRSLYSLFVLQPFASSNAAHILLNLCATFSFTALLILGWKPLRKSYSIWMAFFLLYILLYPALDKPDPLLSNQRFVLEMFPAFMTLALITKRQQRLHHVLLLFFPTLLAILSIGFLLNRWVV